MEDTVIPGVGRSPMSDVYDVKILICYLLSSVKSPMSREQINEIFQEGQYVNYFTFCEALNELQKSNHITAEKAEFDEIYTLNSIGYETAQKLATALPASLKDRIVTAAIALLAKTKLLRENEVTTEEYQNGYNVCCVMHDDGFDLLQFKLFVPDMLQAEKIKETFLKDPVGFYRSIIGMLID